MKGFIEVIESNGAKRLINPLRCQFSKYTDGICGVDIDGRHYLLSQTYDEVKELIRKSQEDKAPEMLEELKKTVVDLKKLKYSLTEPSKKYQEWAIVVKVLDKWISRKEQLIKEATEINTLHYA
jgi:hypothetical protein